MLTSCVGSIKHVGTDASFTKRAGEGGFRIVMSWPKIINRSLTRLSPWAELVERHVVFQAGSAPELYHSLQTKDYVQILAMMPDGRLPLVHQYRPALESISLELPAGMLEEGEDLVHCAQRELLEETGLTSINVHPLGS